MMGNIPTLKARSAMIDCADPGRAMMELCEVVDALAARVAALEDVTKYIPRAPKDEEPLRGYGDAMDEEACEEAKPSDLVDNTRALDVLRVEMRRVAENQEELNRLRAELQREKELWNRLSVAYQETKSQLADTSRAVNRLIRERDAACADLERVTLQRDEARRYRDEAVGKARKAGEERDAFQAKLEAIRDCVGRSYDAESLRELAAVTTGHKRIAAELTADLLDILDDKTPTDA